MKIDIIGSVASGKTTLARNISLKYGVPYYEKDNIVWEQTENGDKRRTPKERDRIFNSIIEKESWIVEGSPRKNLRESFDVCDYIIVLDIGTHVRLFRVLKRWILQKSGKIPYNSKPTLKFLWCNIVWVFEYNHMKKDLMKSLSKYGRKCRVFTGSAKAMRFIDCKF